ncbi:MAG: histidine kinase [Cytophagia bacterium]|nr:histidine kinase [Cytophagia bacterium]
MKNTLIPKSIVFGLFCFAVTVAVVVYLNQMDRIVDHLVQDGISAEIAELKLRGLIIVKFISVCLLVILFILGVRISKNLIEKEQVKLGLPVYLIYASIYGGICTLAYEIFDLEFGISMLTSEPIATMSQSFVAVFLFHFTLGLGTLLAATSFSLLIGNNHRKKKITIGNLGTKYWLVGYFFNFLIICLLYFFNSDLNYFSLGLVWVFISLLIMAFISTTIGTFFLASLIGVAKPLFSSILESISLAVFSSFGVFSFFMILWVIALGLDSALASMVEYLPSYALGILIITLISGGLSTGIWKLNLMGVRKDFMLATTQSELSNLKSQINPHFLFNSLNSLYGLALEESSSKTSTGIQKLSEMMRFMLRENVEDTIEISREFEYVENYIELQKLRVDGNEKVRLEYDIDKACEGDITPMLIIPFIENAFKHGVSAHLESWIDIKLKCEKDSIHLNVKNSNHRKTKSTEEESGIGMENVRQRLAMLYPNRHLFQIFDNDESFEINLKIELN